MAVVRFAHITDLHGTDPGRWPLPWLVSKRLLGYLSWRRRRRHEHRPEILAALVAALRDLDDEVILVTGDLCQIGLPVEFRAARRLLEELGPPERVLLVPGNHDSYGPAPLAETYALWADYLGGLKAGSPGPRVDRRDGVVFLGLDSALPTAPFLATGRLGRAQLEALDRELAALAGDPALRVLYLHHPPDPGAVGRRKALVDDAELMRLLATRGVDLVLHGHDHRPRRDLLDLGGRRIPVLSLASGSARGSKSVARRAAIHRHRISPSPVGWTLELEVLRHDPGTGRFVPVEEASLAIPGRG
ncbi:MAG: metallophosphoesterase [Planctomycetes bacterium]|nr:metallophosphoesterase [Planctomycetota bacterium]